MPGEIREYPLPDIMVGVSLKDLALALYKNAPHATPEEPWCHTCGCQGAAHYCPKQEAARHRLSRYLDSEIARVS